MKTLNEVLLLIDSELTRAEAVVKAANGNIKLHGPTTDHHRGQVFALTKVKHYIGQIESYPAGPLEIEKTVRVHVSWRTIVFAAIALAIFTGVAY